MIIWTLTIIAALACFFGGDIAYGKTLKWSAGEEIGLIILEAAERLIGAVFCVGGFLAICVLWS